jgi:hypothetical protein
MHHYRGKASWDCDREKCEPGTFSTDRLVS